MTLDEAWAEAEAALPEGWRIDTLRIGRNYPHEPEVEWVVWAEKPDYFAPRDGRTAFGSGPTPTAALQALAAALRETPA
ncbi:MAG: hypothetical protein Q8Q29_00650 [Actinomycetota bacterium]|nr:hypothetical protein [Actinomycetota bacterium]